MKRLLGAVVTSPSSTEGVLPPSGHSERSASLSLCDVESRSGHNTHNSCTQPLVTMAATEMGVFAVSTMACDDSGFVIISTDMRTRAAQYRSGLCRSQGPAMGSVSRMQQNRCGGEEARYV